MRVNCQLGGEAGAGSRQPGQIQLACHLCI